MADTERHQELSIRTDEQHRELDELFDSAQAAVKSAGRMGPAEVGLLARLVSATEEHFRTEEEMMRLMPGWQQRFGWHIEQHRVLLFELIKLREDALRREAGSSLTLLDYLHRWMTDHVTNVDPSLDAIILSAHELDRDLLNAGAVGHEQTGWIEPDR